MMSYTHVAITLLIARLFSFISFSSWPEIVFLVTASLLPDIDQPKGFLPMLTRPITYKLHEWFGHRSATHSILFSGTGICIVSLLSQYYAWLFLIAYGGHILSDMLTYSGVKLFYPYNYRIVLLNGPLLTGKSTELIITFLCIIILFVLEVYL